jgi:hypothetical protein
MDTTQPPNEGFAPNRDDFPFWKQGSYQIQSFSIIRVIIYRYQYCVIGNVKVCVAGRKTLFLRTNATRHG